MIFNQVICQLFSLIIHVVYKMLENIGKCPSQLKVIFRLLVFVQQSVKNLKTLSLISPQSKK